MAAFKERLTKQFNVIVHFRSQKTYTVETESADKAEEEAARRFRHDCEGKKTEIALDFVENAVEVSLLRCPYCGKDHLGSDHFTEACGYASPTRYAVLDPKSIVNEKPGKG